MLRDAAEMKARIEEEYRARAEAEARAKIEAEEAAKKAEADSAAAAAAVAARDASNKAAEAAATASAAAAAANGTANGRGLRLTSPGGSSDGTEVNSLSARSSEAGGGGVSEIGPPFSGGRMLDVAEAEEMNAAIKQLYLKTPSGSTPFVLFKARLRTSRREWNIERRYSDFVWLHEVSFFVVFVFLEVFCFLVLWWCWCWCCVLVFVFHFLSKCVCVFLFVLCVCVRVRVCAFFILYLLLLIFILLFFILSSRRMCAPCFCFLLWRLWRRLSLADGIRYMIRTNKISRHGRFPGGWVGGRTDRLSWRRGRWIYRSCPHDGFSGMRWTRTSSSPVKW